MTSNPAEKKSGGPTERRSDAERFEALLDLAERVRTQGLPFDELRELGRLYRLSSTRLARLRAGGDDPEAIRHLNALCVRAYTFLYSAAVPARGARPQRSWWELLGSTWRAQAIAWLLLMGGMLVGGALGYRDPRALPALLPASMGYSANLVDRLVASPSARAQFLERDATPAARNVLFGSFLFVNNTRVALLAFATGMLAGVPTALLQLYNGILIGAFASIFLRDPWPVHFFAWILPHGIPELTAITLCAAAGLLLGEAVAAPGRQRRREAVRRAATPALMLFATAVPLLALAAVTESFVRESALGTGPRLGVAGLMAGGLLIALASVRRLNRKVPDTSWLRDVIGPVRSGSSGTG